MAEITKDDSHDPSPGRPHTSPPPILDISQWVERYVLMAGTLASRFPDKAPEFFAYLATIVWAERNYKPGSWVAYNKQYRRKALVRRYLNWSQTDTTLYSEAFTGRAKTIPRCRFCFHGRMTTPLRTARATQTPQHSNGFPLQLPNQPASRKDKVCANFNHGRCTGKKAQRCCQSCQGNRPVSRCPQRNPNYYNRPRSPRQTYSIKPVFESKLTLPTSTPPPPVLRPTGCTEHIPSNWLYPSRVLAR